MATPKSFQELLIIYRQEVQGLRPGLTDFSEGSINDIMAGGMSSVVQEATRVLVQAFRKTFFRSAEGTDLETLAIDHFGSTFGRPGIKKAVGIAKFTRPTDTAGDVTITVGDIVKTSIDANGNSQRFVILATVTMTALEIFASIEAVIGGPDGDVGPGNIDVIETTLTDPTVVVTNELSTAGGDPEENDELYRETIIQLIQTLKGATKQAITARALTVPGVETASPIEKVITVIEFNPATQTTIGDPFLIPDSKLYIADANGSANQALIDLVVTALFEVRACGVLIDVVGATAQNLDWTVALTLNPNGPNFILFQTNTQLIKDSMKQFIDNLPIGATFSRELARNAILLIWGPTPAGGSGDLTDFATTIPAGDIDPADNIKLIAGTMSTT